MQTRQDVLNALKALKPEVMARYPVREIGLFGSFVRDEPRESGDIDVLVDFGEEASLFDLVGLALFLEERLGRKVDVVPKRALRQELRETVVREMAVV